MKKLTKARTCVYNVNYHIIFCVKYRNKVLSSDIEKRLKEIAYDVAKDKDFKIQRMEVGELDHVHMFVSAHPKIAPSYIVKMVKGITGRKLLIEFPELINNLWKGQLWSNSFYIETVGSISEDAIKAYIEKQSKIGRW
jgi:putative transposase